MICLESLLIIPSTTRAWVGTAGMSWTATIELFIVSLITPLTIFGGSNILFVCLPTQCQLCDIAKDPRSGTDASEFKLRQAYLTQKRKKNKRKSLNDRIIKSLLKTKDLGDFPHLTKCAATKLCTLHSSSNNSLRTNGGIIQTPIQMKLGRRAKCKYKQNTIILTSSSTYTQPNTPQRQDI